MSTIQYQRFEANLTRVSSLVGLYKEVKKDELPTSVRAADILRAAVVFLHGAQEEYIRSLMIEWLPRRGNAEAIKNIPLFGTDCRVYKFTLQDIRAFNSDTVYSLLCLSVEQAMSRQTFNSFAEINSWLSKLAISLESLSSTDKASVDKLTQRRHRIVHEVDMVADTGAMGSKSGKTASINVQTVEAWIAAVGNMIASIDLQVEAWGCNEDDIDDAS